MHGEPYAERVVEVTRPSSVISREAPATHGVLCERCAAELDGAVAIAPQQLQLRPQRSSNASLIDVWGQALLLDPRTPIGRADVSHGLVIVQPSVSRTRAVIELRDGWYVRDVGSSAGTFVNDQPVRELALHSGDR